MMRVPSTRRGGFTLTEMMVTVGVFVIGGSVALPFCRAT